jgi:hypothetical protein
MNRNKASTQRTQARRDRLYSDLCDGNEYEFLYELAAIFGVSRQTIAHDLWAMQRVGLLSFEYDSLGIHANTIRVLDWTPESEAGNG